MQKVMAIPRDEIETHFALNTRQDVKVVAPELLSGELIAKLTALGRALKPEQPLDGIEWKHSPPEVPNTLLVSSEFASDFAVKTDGPFALCFANEKGPQDAHYHPHHLEIYYSEHPLEAEFRLDAQSPIERVNLPQGGVLVFAAGVIHRARLGGLAVVIEIPAVKDDKVVVEL